jgi:hypothetical protein
MRLLVLVPVLAGCAPYPTASGPGRTGELTVQQCSGAPADAVAPGTGTAPPGGAPAAPPPPEPQVKVGELSLPAAASGAAIRAAVTEAVPKLRRCYAQALENVPGLEGKLTVAFRIDTAGKVASAEGRSGFHAGVTACVEDVVRALRFPAPAAAVDVSAPLTFRLPDDDAPAAPAPAPAVPAPAVPATGDAGVPEVATPAAPPTFPGDADAFASSVVAQAIQERADAIIGCARPGGNPVQLGFDVTLTIRGAAIGDARVRGLVDPAAALCIGGVLKGVALSAAPQADTGARCSLILRPR